MCGSFQEGRNPKCRKWLVSVRRAPIITKTFLSGIRVVVLYRVNFRFFTSGQQDYPNVTDSAEIFRFGTSGLLDYAKVMFPPKFLYRCDVSAKVVSSRRSAFSECDILRADLSKCDTLLLCGSEARLDLKHSPNCHRY